LILIFGKLKNYIKRYTYTVRRGIKMIKTFKTMALKEAVENLKKITTKEDLILNIMTATGIRRDTAKTWIDDFIKSGSMKYKDDEEENIEILITIDDFTF
jgi:ribosomal protein S2